MMAEGNQKFAIKNLFDVQGWTVVVTGGGTGIGLMTTQAFANNGARVYITGRRAEVLETTAKEWGSKLLHPEGRIIPVTTDITDKSSIQNLAREVAKHEDHVDVLVNNAGIDGDTSTVEKGDESAEALQEQLWSEEMKMWEEVYRTNVMGHFFTTVAFLPLLSAATKRGAGHIGSVINISSMSGITRMSQHHIAYNTSKAAAIQLNTLLAQEMRRPGVKVRVNSIAPGIFPSEMTASDSNEKNKSTIPTDDSYGKKKGIPAGRPGGEEDMAQAALFLACNQYLYGQIVTVDGGYLLEHP
ncbi:hypothetical protein EVJ58_g7439 [Rhodofomes roseus]|uniref:NAD(P)-binding protein n=1 Tax=Rhodofomes roseus TaxID=34475 RepID=A0A4Y9Y2T4_9APHY|nr:hypothetical protein EVJ58_g7439 [Rhodofomes roseus]